MAMSKSEFALKKNTAIRIGLRVSVHLQRGNFEAARRTIDYAETLIQHHPRAPLFSMPLAQTPMSSRTLNLLERNGVILIGDLVGRGEGWVLSLTGGGSGALSEIRKILMDEISKRKDRPDGPAGRVLHSIDPTRIKREDADIQEAP